jgi:hypothetical protein
MARILKDHVNVEGRWYSRGQSDEQVGDAASRIGEHAWEEVESGDASAAPASPAPEPVPVDLVEDETLSDDEQADEAGTPVDADNAPAVEPAEQPAQEREQDADAPEPPPQSGPGSAEQAWRDYAVQVGVDVSEAEGRAGVIAFIEAAGKPVD